ncbi:MAG TPA: hypothetical protein VGN12_28680 [Pirellulales bacterium]|jgi:hypothetical protein
MQRRVIHTLLACLLAPVVLVVNAVPQSLASCASEPVVVAKKCCGCCKAKTATTKSCCSKKAAEIPNPNCCCTQGPTRPVAPTPSEGQQVVKQALSASLAESVGSSLPLSSSLRTRGNASLADFDQPPVRIRFSIWLI